MLLMLLFIVDVVAKAFAVVVVVCAAIIVIIVAITFKLTGIRKALPLPFAHPFHVGVGNEEGIHVRVDQVVANAH